MDLIDTPTARVLPAREHAVKAIIVHNSGETDLDKCLAFYTHKDGLQPHYFVETTGTVRRIVDEAHVAYHAKIAEPEYRLYLMGYGEWSRWAWNGTAPFHVGYEFPGYFEWRGTWRDGRQLHSPLDLVTGDHPNAVSVGIELQNPTDAQATSDLYTDAQYAALAELVEDIGRRQGVPICRDRVLGHYDVSPMRRCTGHGNWDPGFRFKWNRLWDQVRQVVRVA